MSSHERTLGPYVRARRAARGLTQSDLARLVRVTPQIINRLESGKCRGRPPALRDIAEALQIPASELLARAGYAAEAEYWRAHPATPEPSDPLARFRDAVGALPLRSDVQRALVTLAAEFVRDPEPAFRERFDAAVARHPGRTDADATRFRVLRALLFESDGAAFPEGRQL
jgi:transcriptional regulator with XRE-family HTH domain